jgi:hypothetical protein
MKTKHITFTTLFALSALVGWAQKKDSLQDVSVFDRKKLFWGITFNQTWTKVIGSQPFETYFAKPSLGGDIIVEYFPLKFIGVRAGFGYMQRGTGIKLVDLDHSLGDPDSTYRTRLRFNTWEFPIALVLRTPKDVIKGIRLAGGAGVIPYKNFHTTRIYDSVEDGFHTIYDQSHMYFKNDLAFQAFFGTHINMANYSQFQVELFYTKGTKNVYHDSSFGNANATQRTWGFRVSWVY